MMTIDYSKIAEAIRHYQRAGYQYIEVPWYVPEDINSVTKPAEVEDGFYIKDVYGNSRGELVGSGEQSFIRMMELNLLEPGMYVCCTPCFRVEPDGYDELHHPHFMKVELIDTTPKHELNFIHAMLVAWEFFEGQGIEVGEVKISESQIDLVDKKTGIELGSYGYRVYKDFKWSFGSGVAEPRLSQVLKLNEQSK